MIDPEVPAPPPAAPAPPPLMQDAGMQLPAIAAQLASLYATRDPLKQSLDILDKEISRVETLAHQAMTMQGVRTFTTGEGAMTLKPTKVYVPAEWAAIYSHIQTTGEFDLLHKRLSITACRERGDQLPPGIMPTEFDEFRFTPTKGK